MGAIPIGSSMRAYFSWEKACLTSKTSAVRVRQCALMCPTLVGRERACKALVSWFNSNWTLIKELVLTSLGLWRMLRGGNV